jgi:glycyl-radical enzyme activating protein
MVEGYIFDIARFSLNDGPGIRTTVFLKGCPLHCLWCHNPESQSQKPQLSFNSDHCSYCGKCRDICEKGVHQIEETKHNVDYAKCETCGKCTEECLNSGLTIIGKKASVDDVIQIVQKDKVFYEQSGGGLTLSGGEPLAQLNFTLALLKEAKKMNIHTCVETCGYTTAGSIKKVMPFVDVFLFDFKDSDGVRHKKNTGVSNDLILTNLKLLCESGSKVILRCPIIPGINDTDEHFRKIANIKHSYEQILRVELMPYHDLGNEKGLNLGVNNILKAGNPTIEMKDSWLSKIKSYGCEDVIIG